MIARLGYAGIVVGLIGACAVVVAGIQRARGVPVSDRAFRVSVWSVVIGAAVAFVALEVALLTNDFSIRYVAEHHARSTPLVFAIATAWSALEGSIVLWALVLAGYLGLVWRNHRRVGDDDRLGAGALAVMGAIAVFFFGLLATAANPFQVLDVVPADGPGPNPLLQNHILVAIHPPLLYLGYVGLSVPFAFAISALARRESGPQWVLRTRRWTLIAWTFLTMGIVLGAWWSYAVLGWGGYWAWDPVENASFLPWLVATAYLHSAIVQARRGVLRAWSTALVLATFSLTILGTFLTRSGVIGSVHSFTQSAIGPALLGFLVVVTVAAFALFASRASMLAPDRPLGALASREGSFLVNNLLLTVFAFTVLVGTLYPIGVEAVTGDQLSVGAPFFDTMAIPIALALLLAMGLGPLLPPAGTASDALWPRVRGPLRVGLAAGVLGVLLGLRAPFVLFVIVVGIAIAAASVRGFALACAEIAGRTGWHVAVLGAAVRRQPGFWCGQVAHLGVVVLAVGIAVSGGFAARETVALDRGQAVQFDSYRVSFEGTFRRSEASRSIRGARIVVSRHGSTKVLEPSLRHYFGQDQTITSPAIWTTWRGDDVYVSISSISSRQVVLRLYHYPLIFLIWVGGLLAACGGLAGAVLGHRRPRTPAAPLPLSPAPATDREPARV